MRLNLKQLSAVKKLVRACGALSLADLRSYLGDYLGFGQSEAHEFLKHHGSGCPQNGVSFDSFREGYASLSPYMMMERQGEIIVRKPGSINNQQLNLERLDDVVALVIMMVKHNFGDGLEHSGCLGFRLWVLRVYIFFVYFGC